MKIFLLTISLCYSSFVFSYENESYESNFEECGEYEVAGVVRFINHYATIVVHENTQSQYNLSVPPLDEVRLGSYNNFPISINVILNRNLTQMNKGQAVAVTKNPTRRIPNPLNPKNTGFKLISTQNCEDK